MTSKPERGTKPAAVVPFSTDATMPPNGWQLHSPKFGFMRTDTGENLVSFIELVQWLMHARETHRPGAMRMVLDAITADVLPCIYFTSRDAPAQSFADLAGSPWAQFGPEVPSRYEGAHRAGRPDPDLQRWLAQPKATKEAELLKERMAFELAHWFEAADRDDSPRNANSVTALLASEAAELWGYGKTTAPEAPAAIAPASWHSHSAHGFQRSNEKAAGRLVRLAEVLRWLESSKDLPRAAALEALCNAMPSDVLQWCFELQQTDYAKPVPLDCMFGFVSAETIAKSKKQAAAAAQERAFRGSFVKDWDTPRSPVMRRYSLPLYPAAKYGPAAPGRPALVKLLRQSWSVARLPKSDIDVLDDPKAAPVRLAIRLDKAAELWGYGLVVQSSLSIDQPQQQPGEGAQPGMDAMPWTGETLAKQQATFKSIPGCRDFAQRTADMAGMKVREVSRLIKEYTDSQKVKPASPFPVAVSHTTTARKSR